MKTAYVSITYLAMITPQDVGLEENCSDKIFETKIHQLIQETMPEFQKNFSRNDVEINIT